MSQERCERYMRQLAALLQNIDQMRQDEAKMQSVITICRKTDDYERAMEVSNALTSLAKTRAQAEAITVEFANSTSVPKAHELYLDIHARLEMAEKFHDSHRQKLAQFELAAATDAFDGAEGRTEAEKAIEHAKMLYEKQLELLEQVTPARSLDLDVAASMDAIAPVTQAAKPLISLV